MRRLQRLTSAKRAPWRMTGAQLPRRPALSGTGGWLRPPTARPGPCRARMPAQATRAAMIRSSQPTAMSGTEASSRSV